MSTRAALHLLATFVGLIASSAPLDAGTVEIDDGTFLPQDWLDIVVLVDDPAIGGTGPLTSTGSVIQRTTGGNPTFYRRSHHVVQTGDALRTGGIYLAERYEPRLQGPIDTVTFRIHVNHDLLNQGYAGLTGWRPVLLQDNRLYWSEEVATFDGTGWVFPAINNLTEDDFNSSPSPDTVPNFDEPDFSLDGEVIYFGYALTNSAPTNAINEYRGADNWEVDINSASDKLIGDFNGDGLINHADYVVWRNRFEASNRGTGGAFVGADANGNSRADQEDYDYWVMNFGRTAQIPSGGASAVVPEPAAWLMAAAAAGAILSFGRRMAPSQPCCPSCFAGL